MKQKKVVGNLEKRRKGDAKHIKPFSICNSIKYFLGEKKIVVKK